MIPALLLIALVILASAAIAVSLSNLVHSALLLVGSWFGVAMFYLWAGAQFLAFAQVLVYVGAISMVVLFAVLLTRPLRQDAAISPASLRRAGAGVVIGLLVGVVLIGAVMTTRLPSVGEGAPAPGLSARELGLQLMGPHTAALLVLGVVLTVALLGALVIAADDRKRNGP